VVVLQLIQSAALTDKETNAKRLCWTSNKISSLIRWEKEEERGMQQPAHKRRYTVKKVTDFHVLSRDVMSLTKLSLAGNNLVSDIPARDGEIGNLTVQ
jgi:hypothetical protein